MSDIERDVWPGPEIQPGDTDEPHSEDEIGHKGGRRSEDLPQEDWGIEPPSDSEIVYPEPPPGI